MFMYRSSNDLVWVKKVDPNKVYDVLVGLAGAWEQERNHFISIWENQLWHEYRFCGSLGFGGKIWRELKHIRSTDCDVPNLRVSCYPENLNSEREKILKDTDEALLKILVSLRLRQ